MASTTRQIQVFMDRNDEILFSQSLQNAIPKIRFVDDCIWPTEPAVVSSIAHCSTNLCYLWDSASVPHLPTKIGEDGRMRGPQSGVVIQLIRTMVSEDNTIFRSGSLGVGYALENVLMSRFVKTVWKTLRGIATSGTLIRLKFAAGY